MSRQNKGFSSAYPSFSLKVKHAKLARPKRKPFLALIDALFYGLSIYKFIMQKHPNPNIICLQ